MALEDESKVAKAVARDLPISWKKLVNIAKTIRGMMLEEARRYLEEVAKGREPVPYRTHRKKIPHHRGVADRWGIPQAKYPRKAAKLLLKLLQNLEANAENKGLDVSRLRLVHVGVHKSYTIRKYMPRAFGRATKWFRKYSNVEVVAVEG